MGEYWDRWRKWRRISDMRAINTNVTAESSLTLLGGV